MTTVSIIAGVPHLTPVRSGSPPFPLTLPVTTLGRGVMNELPIEGEQISRRHAVVVRDGQGFVLHDLGSLNGVWVNAEALSNGAHRPLRDGDRIRLGDQQLVFRDPRPAPRAPAAERAPPRRAAPKRRGRVRVRSTRALRPPPTTRAETQRMRLVLTACALLAGLLAAALSLVLG